MLVGFTRSFGAVGLDAYLVRTDAEGRVTWMETFGGDRDDFGYTVQQTTDGGYVFTGYTESGASASRDVYVARLHGE